MGKSCCRAEVKFFKLRETHETQSAVKIANHHYREALPLYTASSLALPVLEDYQNLFPLNEPAVFRSSLFLSNRTLRI